MKILLVTNSEDKSSDYICSKISDFFRFDTDDFITKYHLTVSNSSWSIINNKTSESISSEDIIGGYYRRPSVPVIPYSLFEKELINKFCIESYEVYQTMIESINCKWLCDPKKVRIAENRILQLHYAEEVGFKVPNYMFSNNEIAIKQFINFNSPACMKTLQMGPFSFDGKKCCFYNTIINESDVSDLSGIPVQVQGYITKKEEYRVIAIGKELFPVLIESQENETTKSDWRVNNCLSVTYKRAILDEKLMDLCFRLLSKFEINFASMDIIRGSDDNYYFLDLNPNGQWVWLDELLNLNICNSMKRFFYE